MTSSGQVLTDADIEALADEAERGYDLSEWRIRPGRPFLGAAQLAQPGEHSPRIAVRLPAELHRRVRQRASAEERSVSQVVRDLLEDYAGPPQTLEAQHATRRRQRH
jgi:hypothetical protein